MLKYIFFIGVSITIALGCSQKNSTQSSSASLPKPLANSLTIKDVEKNYKSFCAGCHGEKLDAFVDRKWKYGNSREDLFKGIKYGYLNGGMPAYDSAFNTKEIYALADYILAGIKNRERYDFNETPKQNLFISEEQNVKLDTVVSGLNIPWAIAFLPNNEMLVTEKSGNLHMSIITKPSNLLEAYHL